MANRLKMKDIEAKGWRVHKTACAKAISSLPHEGVSELASKTTHPPNIKQSKYKNKKTEGFDSKHEYECYKQLELRQKSGQITGLLCQVTFHIINGVSYKADFLYYDKELRAFVVADAKGMKTKEYIIKKKMMKELLSIEIKEM